MSPAWAFVIDGHIFYVLNDMNGDTMICDLRTGQWHHWYTGAAGGQWNMYRGIVWKGRVLAADVEDPIIWELDAALATDEGSTQIKRVVTAFQAVRGKASMRQGSLRVTASVGTPSQAGAIVYMRFSDDEGLTWSTPRQITLLSGNYAQPLRFRSLGRLRAPGRIWEIYDTGGLITLEGADADMENK